MSSSLQAGLLLLPRALIHPRVPRAREVVMMMMIMMMIMMMMMMMMITTAIMLPLLQTANLVLSPEPETRSAKDNDSEIAAAKTPESAKCLAQKRGVRVGWVYVEKPPWLRMRKLCEFLKTPVTSELALCAGLGL